MPRFVAVHPVGFSEEQLGPLAKELLPEGELGMARLSRQASHAA